MAEDKGNIELAPDDATAYNNRGLAYHYLGQHQRAIQDYNNAVQLDPDRAVAYHNRDSAYAALFRPTPNRTGGNNMAAMDIKRTYRDSPLDPATDRHYQADFDKAVNDLIATGNYSREGARRAILSMGLGKEPCRVMRGCRKR